MALSKEEILDAIASMSVLEVSELIKMMVEKFGVSAAAAAVAVAVLSAEPLLEPDELEPPPQPASDNAIVNAIMPANTLLFFIFTPPICLV